MSLKSIIRGFQLWKIRQFVFSRSTEIFYCVDVDQVNDQKPGLADFEFYFGSEDDLVFLEMPDMDYDESSLLYSRKRLAAGDKVILGRYGEDVVFYVWVSLGELQVVQDQFIKIPGDCAFTYKSWVRPDYRGKNIMSSSYILMAEWLYANGFRLIFTLIREDNIPSRNYAKKVGFIQRGTVTHLRVLGMKFNIFFLRRQEAGHRLKAIPAQSAAARRPATAALSPRTFGPPA